MYLHFQKYFTYVILESAKGVAVDHGHTLYNTILGTRNPASRASERVRLVAIRPSSYVHRMTLEVAVSFLPEVIAQI